MPTLKFRAKRAAAAVVATASLVGLAGCQMGFDAATLTQYTQAEGINVDLADGESVEQGRGAIKVRNLLIVAQPDGSAQIAGVIYGSPSTAPYDVANTTPTLDTLESISGRALEPNGDAKGDLTVSLPAPLEVTVESPARLEDQGVAISGAELVPGVDAELTLTFAENGSVTARVPVIDGTKEDFATMAPVSGAEASASPEATPAPEATPDAAATPAAEGTQD